jgi:epoxyqueuosine reductase
VPAAIRPALRLTVFGCDICQSCCPWNRKALPQDASFAPRKIASLDARELAALTPAEYAALVPGTALARAGYHGLRRNALLALGARGEQSARAVIALLCDDPEPLVRDAAQWALAELDRK